MSWPRYIPLRGKKAREEYLNDIEIGRAETLATWRSLFALTFDKIPGDHPLISSYFHNTAVSMMEKAVDDIYTGIIAATSNSSSEIISEIQILQDVATSRFINMVTKVYDDIRKCRKYDPQINAAFDGHQANAISDVVSATRSIFSAIRILLAVFSSETEAGSMEDDLSSITALSKEAGSYGTDWVKNVYDSIDILCLLDSKNQDKIPEGFDPAIAQ